MGSHATFGESDGYYVAYKPITIPCVTFIIIEIKLIHCPCSVIFEIKFMSI